MSNEGKRDEMHNAVLNFEVIVMQEKGKMSAAYWETTERSKPHVVLSSTLSKQEGIFFDIETDVE